jgi:hypothetical protein
MSRHPDYRNIRGLGSLTYDASSEPGRFTQYTTTLDYNQSRSEAVDVDMEVEGLLNGSYAQARRRGPHCLEGARAACSE